MFKRLVLLVLLALATASVSTPAHAATLAVQMQCEQTSVDWTGMSRFFSCWAYASGGSPNYTFHWYHLYNGAWSFVYQETNGGSSQVYDLQCRYPDYPEQWTSGTAKVVVTDSAGAQVTAQSTARCYRYVP